MQDIPPSPYYRGRHASSVSSLPPANDPVHLHGLPLQHTPIFTSTHSPFVNKVCAFFSYHGIPYILEPVDLDIQPKGKIPFVRYHGQVVSDERVILEWATETFGVLEWGTEYDEEERAIAIVIQRMMDEHVFMISTYSIFAISDNWAATIHTIGHNMLAPLRRMLHSRVRSTYLELLTRLGFMGTSQKSLYGELRCDLGALSNLLGSDRYFFGKKKPGPLDLTVWSHLMTYMLRPDDEVTRIVLGYGTLMRLIKRVTREMTPRWTRAPDDED